MFQVGGNAAYRYDYEIPLQYGVDQCIGDSMGPGGVLRCLRSAPVLVGIGQDMAELCPDAWVLNYVNPMGAVCTTVGALPPHPAAMNQSNLTVQGLAAEAARKGDPELAFWAVAMDPLTSAVLSLKQIRDMVAEMPEAEREWLQQFEGKTLRKLPQINVPPDTVPVPAPVDPALAINARFGKLGG